MMKQPQQKEPKHDMDDFDERIAAVQLQIEPSWNKYRSMAEIMIDHEFFPPIPQDKIGNKQWAIDELSLRLEFCYAMEISPVLANKLNKIQNSYELTADMHSIYFKKAHRKAEFEPIESTNKTCKIRGRLLPTHNWTYVTFDEDDARDQGLLSKNNKSWMGNGRQNMLAKNCRMKAETILDRAVMGAATYEKEPDTDLPEVPNEDSHEEIGEESTQQQEVEAKTQIVSFSKSPEQIIEEPKTEEVFEVVDIVEPLEPEPEPINTQPFTPEEIKTIRDQKISELPPSKDDPIEILETNQEDMIAQDVQEIAQPEFYAEIIKEPVNMLAREEVLEPSSKPEEPIKEEEPKSNRKTKQTKKSIKEVVEKPDTSFLDKTPLKESTIPELKKPFGMSQLTINDPKFHTETTYNHIGDDWYRSLTIQEFQELAAIDMNITAFRTILEQVYPDAIPKIEAQYNQLIKESNPNEKLAVLYHDAMSMIENPPELSIIDLKYMELMEKMVLGLEKLAIILKKEHPENPLEFIVKASQGKWGNKEAVWGYKYMQARHLI